MLRRATREDVEDLIRLRIQLLRSLVNPNLAEETIRVIEGFFREIWDPDNPVYFVAVEEDKIVGMAAASLFPGMPSVVNPYGKCALIYDVIVDDDFRGKGVGRELMRSLLGYCRQEQVGFIHLNSSDMGKNLYLSLGFKEYSGYPEMRLYYQVLQELDL